MINWKRHTTRPHNFINSSIADMEPGHKRKQAENMSKKATGVKGEKKRRIVEHEQGIVSTLGLVEVARQPYPT